MPSFIAQGPRLLPTAFNTYVAEDGITIYVAEDGITSYIPES